MPRTKRVIPLGAALHVICRGNNRQPVFREENDKLKYYTLLRDLKLENRIKIFHYCLMGNHMHAVFSPEENNTLSKFMKQVNLTYFHYYKSKYGHFGHLWQDRFKSNVIEMEAYLIQCGKYIELNPVRAGMVVHPGLYAFSSYNFYASGKKDSLITPSPMYLGLSESESLRQQHYIDFVIDSDIINSNELDKKVYIGSKGFAAKLQEQYKIGNNRPKSGRPPKQNN